MRWDVTYRYVGRYIAKHVKKQIEDPERLKGEIDRLLRSHTFSKGARARQLLRHLGERATNGRQDEIKESTIAFEVFRRGAYDPKVDSVVRVEIGRLRKLLDDYYAAEASNSGVRVEIPKGSYIPRLYEESQIPAPTTIRRHRPWFWWGAAATVAIASGILLGTAHWNHQSVVTAAIPAFQVRPFEVVEGGEAAKEAAVRVVDEIVTRLIDTQGIRVVTSRASRTDAHAVVEGSVAIREGQIRVVVRLTATRHNLHFWKTEAVGPVDSKHEVERKAALAVREAFPLNFMKVKRALVRQTTHSPEAFHYYLRASYLGFGDTDEMRQAISFTDAAIAADPKDALSYAAKGQLIVTLMSYGESPGGDAAVARNAAQEALRLDPDLPEAWRLLGCIRILLDRDWGGAEQAFRRAIELDPTYGEARYDYARLVLTPNRRFDEAVSQLEQALALSPEELDFRRERVNVLIKSGRIREARAQLATERAGHATNVLNGIAAFHEGNIPEAESFLRRAVEIYRGSWALGHLGYVLARTGRRQEAKLILKELARHNPPANVEMAALTWALEQQDAAVAYLRSGSHLAGMLWLDVDHRFDELRTDPRVRSLRREIGLAGSE